MAEAAVAAAPLSPRATPTASGDVVDSAGTAHTYIIPPNFRNKFRPNVVKQIIKEVLSQRLQGVQYQAENSSQYTREIADEIKARLKELNLERYKFVVQVVIGEQRGEGCRMSCRCFWDSDSDSYASETFMNDSIFCVAAAFGVYFY